MQYTTICNLRVSRLILGTAQLGSAYGIANTAGKLEDEAANKILEAAAEKGVNCFDTAPSYGESEKIIGKFIDNHSGFMETPVIITKLPPVVIGEKVTFNSVYSHVKQKLISSLSNLRTDRIDIYLLHRASDIEVYDGLVFESCLKLKEEGLIGLVGISVYSPQEVELAAGKGRIDVIQVPLNIFDHRLIQSGLLSKLTEKHVIVFARSIFLQGLLFLDENKLPKSLEIARMPLNRLHQLAYDCGINIAELSLNFVRDLPGVTSLVVGAETPRQVTTNIDLMESPAFSGSIHKEILSLFSNLPLEIINPSLWRL